MLSQKPVYQLQAFSENEAEKLFHMRRLETVLQEFKDINKPHSHSFYLVMWIKDGSGTHTIDAKTYSIAPNQLYFLSPGKVHSWQASADSKGYNLYFDSNFCRGRVSRRLYHYPFFQSTKHEPFLVITDQQSLFSGIFDFIYEEYTGNQSNRYEVILSACHIVLELADRLYNQQWTNEDTYLYDRVRQYEQLIEDQFLTVREVSAYAAQMHLTPHYLNQLCKKILGKTASQLFQERILLEASYLLRNTTLSIKEIGFRLGFQDPSYFVRFFRKNSGETPANFRLHQKDKR
ncbi:helix-turn-helix domain-containing protein [Larkinella knui]|uniref:Helix-turn-helix domain-containing protein n=1 Tax=Larkinella knui TaxID=2025310 RepID=A0A3P1CWW8_9BACT|nr:helix-turn-helix transcriptional regulator [Larkinella knui]RRB17580.1 helix-turn-helix domain-containing protein [Larkinella knui]